MITLQTLYKGRMTTPLIQYLLPVETNIKVLVVEEPPQIMTKIFTTSFLCSAKFNVKELSTMTKMTKSINKSINIAISMAFT